MDLANWPPQSGGTYTPGEPFPISAEEVTIQNVLYVMKDHVTVSCDFRGRPATYDLFVPDEKTAKKIAKILADNHGKTLMSIGTIPIPEDTGSE